MEPPPRLGEAVVCDFCDSVTAYGSGRVFTLPDGSRVHACKRHNEEITKDNVLPLYVAGKLTKQFHD